MGRSEAPLSRDRREETPGEANRKTLVHGSLVEESALNQRRRLWLVCEMRSFAALSLSSMSKTPSQGQLNSDYSSFKISIEFIIISLGVLCIPES